VKLKTLYLTACILVVMAMPLGAAPTARPLTWLSTQIITPTASTALAPDSNCDFAIMTVKTAGIHINFGNAAATTTGDQYFPPGAYTWDNQRGALAKMRVINSSDGAATVGVSYWKGN